MTPARYRRRAVVAIVLAALIGVSSTEADPGPIGRSSTDRPDELAGPQLHLIYAIPSDGTDRALDSNGVIANSIGAAQSWLASQTGGRKLRLDTYAGQADSSFVQLPETDAQLASRGVYLRDELEKLLPGLGFNSSQKLYEVYYDGSNPVTCGGGSWPPALVGHVVALYLRGTPPGFPACDTNAFAPAGAAPGYLEFSALHEVVHALGLVATCAPHHVLAGHVSDSPSDLMYAGDQPWRPSVLDLNHDDYFQANIPGCLDLARSAFLDGGTDLPPGWRTTVTVPPPANATAPTITGRAVVGQRIQEVHGIWSGVPTSYSYQWETCDTRGAGCLPIAGATEQSYIVATLDLGRTVRVVENASNGGGSGSPTASAVSPPVTKSGGSGGDIITSLERQMTPTGRAAAIPAVLKNSGYRLAITPPQAGALAVNWYILVPSRPASGTRPRAVLVASGHLHVEKARRTMLFVALTPNGGRVLRRAKQVAISARASLATLVAPPITGVRRFTLLR